MGKCLTIARLEQIKPGDKVIYYRGNLILDIERSFDVPAYQAQLMAVRDLADSLHQGGRARLDMRVVARGHNNHIVYEYVAIGVA